MKILFLLIFSIPLHVFAGPISSGGGDAVVCYSPTGSIQSAQLLDFFEGRVAFGDKHFQNPNYSIKDYLNIIVKRSHKTGYSLRQPGILNLADAIKIVATKRRFLPKGVRLKPVNDSFEFIIAENCKVEQAAVFTDESNILFDAKIWKALSLRDRAGLLVHEAVYWLDRQKSKVRDSRRSRRIVSLFFQEKWNFKNIFSDLPTEHVLCQGGEFRNDILIGSTVFAAHRMNSFWRLLFFQIDGSPVISEKVSYIPIEFPLLESKNESHYYSATLETKSNFETGDKMRFSRSPSKERHLPSIFRLDGEKTSYPKKAFNPTQIRCRKIY